MARRTILRTLCFGALLIGAAAALLQAQQPGPGTVIQVASQLVVLDVTVLDKHDRPVFGLSRDDFTVEEDNQPEAIASFQAPQAGSASSDVGNIPASGAPATILVLDLLNSNPADAGYYRTELQKYLQEQPAYLAAPTELMVLRAAGSFRSVQGYTHNRAALLAALAAAPPDPAFEATSEDFYLERFTQTIYALEQIALENKGVPGGKDILWLGAGFTNIRPEDYTYQAQQGYFRFLRRATDALVEVRARLFVFYPPGNFMEQQTVRSSYNALGKTDPFSEGMNFGVFVKETGGKLFYNRNDIDHEISDAQAIGSASYTLSYRPPPGPADGRFRRIEVSVRGHDLRVLTKAGYYARAGSGAAAMQQAQLMTLADVAQSPLPFDTLKVSVRNLARDPESGAAHFIIALASSRLVWAQGAGSTSTTDVTFAAISRNKERDILASSLKMLTITSHTQDAQKLPLTLTLVPMTVQVPPSTADVRVVVQAAKGGWLGSADIERARIAAAPLAPLPSPSLVQRSAGEPAGSATKPQALPR